MSAYETIRSVTRLSTFLVFLAATGLLGFIYESRVLIALFEASVAFLILSYAYVVFAARRISVRRELYPRAYEEEQLEVTLHIDNAGFLPAYLVEVQDWFPTDPTPLKSLVIPELPGRAAGLRTRYRAGCDRGRGRFTIGPVKMTVTDPLGFFQRTRILPVFSELVVYPRTFPMGDLGLRYLQSSQQVSTSSPLRAGQTPLFYGTREYQPGDNPRHIHWRMSARWGELILKTFESSANVDLTCVLDLHRGTLRGVGRGNNIELAIRIAASIAEHAIRRDHPFQLVADGDEAILLPPRVGQNHLIGCLDTLARVKPHGKLEYGDLLRRGARFVGAGSAVVLVFNTLDFDRDAFFTVASEWERKRVHGIAVIMDDSTFIPMEEMRPARDPARLLAAVDLLRQFRYSVYTVRSGDNLAEVFAGLGVVEEAEVLG